MKNFKTVLLLLFLLSAVAGRAQTDFAFGVYGAPSVNYVQSQAPGSDGGSKVMFGFGLIAEFAFAEKYAFATGLDIINKGGTLELADTTGTYRANYVQVPLTLKLRTREFGYFTYYATFGGAIAVQTSEDVTFEPNVPVSQRDNDLINPVNGTFIIGLGAEYSLGGSTRLTGGLQYNKSLFDDVRDDHPRYSSNEVYRFDYFSLVVGVLF